MKKLCFNTLIILMISFFPFQASAVSVLNVCTDSSRDTMQQAYIAYYGRPGDPGGITFWCNKLDSGSGSLDAIIEQFGNSDEFETRYGSLTNSALVDTIYQQMFGRNPDAAGKNFYLGKLNSNAMTLQTITLNVLNGSNGKDAIIINNKTQASNYFTEKVDSTGFVYNENNIDDVVALFSSISSDSNAYELVVLGIDVLINSGSELFYQTNISTSIVQGKCLFCHVSNGFSGHTNLVFFTGSDESTIADNYSVMSNFITMIVGNGDLMLSKTQGVAHGGGVQFVTDSVELQALQKFVLLIESGK